MGVFSKLKGLLGGGGQAKEAASSDEKVTIVSTGPLSDNWQEIEESLADNPEALAEFEEMMQLEENSEKLVDACRQGDYRAVSELLNSICDIDHISREGLTPLVCAAGIGHKLIVKTLIAKGAEVDRRETNAGLTPLITAVMNGQEAVARILLDAGADIDQLSRVGTTALSTACYKGYENLVRMLLEAGADAELGTEPPMVAAKTENIRQLLRSNA